jgi:hypothetical protein
MSSDLISLLLIGAVSLFVVLASLRQLPDLGMALSLVLIALVTWIRPGGLEQLGFLPLQNWPRQLLLSFVVGALLSLGAPLLLEPLAERLTGKPHQLQLLDHLRGDLRATLWLLPLVWLVVAPLEEVLFRGFLMNEIAHLLGNGSIALLLNLLLSSALFGFAHCYQGPSGVLSTGMVGAVLGAIFIGSGFNLWPAIFTHAIIDTLSLLLIYLSLDTRLKGIFQRSELETDQESDEEHPPHQE